MPATYEPIATATGTGSSGTITFSSVPSTYTDIVLVANPVYTVNTVNTNIRVNGDTGNNYSETYVRGNGTAASSGRDANANLMFFSATGAGVTTANRDNGIAHFMNYANTTTYKTVLMRYNQPGQFVLGGVSMWRNTAAITSISIITDTGNFSTNSTFTLYGIKSA